MRSDRGLTIPAITGMVDFTPKIVCQEVSNQVV